MNTAVNMTQMLETVDRIEGWLFDVEPVALIHLPLAVDHLPGNIVEIGSYRGKSTVAIGLGSALLTRSQRPVYAIDPFIPDNDWYFDDYFPIFWNNVKEAGLENYVIPIAKYSTEAYEDCPDQIALLFIDGDHSYDGVMHDIFHYTPRVVPGGLIAFHDYWREDGVAQAVNEMLQSSEYEHVCDYTSIRVIRKI